MRCCKDLGEYLDLCKYILPVLNDKRCSFVVDYLEVDCLSKTLDLGMLFLTTTLSPGVANELWNKRWSDTWKSKYAVQEWVENTTNGRLGAISN